MTQQNDAAFARAAFYHPEAGVSTSKDGLTKREYFAAMAIQGFMVNHTGTIEELVKMSVIAADALIKELNK